MKLLLFIITIFIGQLCVGQKTDTLSILTFECDKGKAVELNEEVISKIFEESIKQPVKGKIAIGSNDWLACNTDSSFFRLDTVYFCSNSYYKNKQPNTPNCCNLLSWTFYEKDAFISTQLNLCTEPATSTPYTDNNNFKIKVVFENGNYYLQLFNNSKLVENFRILNITTFPKCNLSGTTDIMILLRVH